MALATMEITGKLDNYPQLSRARTANEQRYYIVVSPSVPDESSISPEILRIRSYNTAKSQWDRTGRDIQGRDKIGGYCIYLDEPRVALNGCMPGDTVKAKVTVYPVNIFTQNREHKDDIRHSNISQIHMELEGTLTAVKAKD